MTFFPTLGQLGKLQDDALWRELDALNDDAEARTGVQPVPAEPRRFRTYSEEAAALGVSVATVYRRRAAAKREAASASGPWKPGAEHPWNRRVKRGAA